MNIDVTQVAAVVRAQFPAIAAASVEHLGEGCDSTAFEVDGRWVFRFPKRADVEQQLLLEMRVLPLLSRHSPLALPEFCFHGRPSAELPRHFVGYPKLAGVPAISIEPTAARFAQWAPSMGRFLSWLHRFPLD